MGLDQRIWAAIRVNFITTKQVAMHYWRKDHAIDEWFFSRLPKADQRVIKTGEWTAWSANLTHTGLERLEANDYSLALKIGFDLELLWRCDLALKQGFRLTYSRSS